MRSLCAKVFCFFSPLRTNTEETRREIDDVQKSKAANHRNSKWSCYSTCFDSSGRIRVWAHDSLTSSFVPVPIHKSSLPAVIWLTPAFIVPSFIQFKNIYLYYSKERGDRFDSCYSGRQAATPPLIQSSFADNCCFNPVEIELQFREKSF